MVDKEKILEHINNIEHFAQKEGNEWLLLELKKRFGRETSTTISQDIKDIRNALNIAGTNSITYNYVSNQILRNQLLIDNLRMENYALDLKTTNESERFYFFCLSAFFQIENMLNYYFYTKFPNINDLLSFIEKTTGKLQDSFKRSGKEKNVGDIIIWYKIYCFCVVCFPFSEKSNDFTYKLLSDLRLVRNEGLHRCDIIKNDKENKLYNFFLHQDFNTIRSLLKKVSDKIESELCHPKGLEAVITSVLPSAICIKYKNGGTDCISTKTTNYKVNDTIIVEKRIDGKSLIITKVHQA